MLSPDLYAKNAVDIMNRNFLFLTSKSTLSDIAILLQYIGSRPKSIPVIQSLENRLLYASLQAQDLRKYLTKTFNE